jgi:broad specificity phosphatase PhoE
MYISPTPLIYAARHGHTKLNGNGFRGSIDVPLTKEGIQDAHKLAFFFEPIEVCCIVSSDKVRATETAKIIADRKCSCFHETESLRAWDVGMFSGKPKNAENKKLLEYYIANPEVPIPDGESLNDFKRRVRPCLIEACDLANENGMPMLLVVHSSIIHEMGSLFNGNQHSTLVWPGGAAAAFVKGDTIKAEPVFKAQPTFDMSSRADTVS